MNKQQGVEVLPVLWSSFVMTHALLFGVSFVVPASPSELAAFAPALALPALVAVGLAVEGSLLGRWVPTLQAWFILRFALAESASILGFLSFFISGERLVQVGCAALALLAHFACFPSGRAREQHAEARARQAS